MPTFVGLILVISTWEGGLLGLMMVMTVGLLYRISALTATRNLWAIMAAVLRVPALPKLFGLCFKPSPSIRGRLRSIFSRNA